MSVYFVAVLAWLLAYIVGVSAYLLGRIALSGKIGSDWQAAVFWSGVCLALALPMPVLSVRWFSARRVTALRLLGATGIFALAAMVPALLFKAIWTGFTFSSTEGRLIALLLVAACAAFPSIVAGGYVLAGISTSAPRAD